MDNFVAIMANLMLLGSNKSTRATQFSRTKTETTPKVPEDTLTLIRQLGFEYGPSLLACIIMILISYGMYVVIKSPIYKLIYWLFPWLKRSHFLHSVLHSKRFNLAVEHIVDLKANVIAEETANILTDIVADTVRKLRSVKGSLGVEIDRKCDSLSQDILRIDVECLMRNHNSIDVLKGMMDKISDRLDFLTEQCLPNPHISELIGPDYEPLDSIPISVKDYMDAKLGKLGRRMILQKDQLHTTLNEERTKVREDLNLIHNFIIQELAGADSKIEKFILETHPIIVHNQVNIQDLQNEMRLINLKVQGLVEECKSLASSLIKMPSTTPIARTDKESSDKLCDSTVDELSPINKRYSTPVKEQVGQTETEIPSVNAVPVVIPTASFTSFPSFMNPPAPIIYQAAGNIPMPKFNPTLDSAEQYVQDLEIYMRRKRIVAADHILMLTPIFEQDKEQKLWWKHAKTVVTTWEEFKVHFLAMYGNEADHHQALEKLLMRRQTEKESFQNFAFEMDLQYRKLYKITNNNNQKEIIMFISERALPNIKAHLLACNAKDLYELIRFGSKIETPVREPRKDWFKTRNEGGQRPDKPSHTSIPKVEGQQKGYLNTSQGQHKDKMPEQSPQRQNEKQGSKDTGYVPICYLCKKTGHVKAQCHSRPNQVNAVQNSPSIKDSKIQDVNSNQGNGRRE